MKRNDLLTGEPFFPQRITQKFTCSKNRIKYHNARASKLRKSLTFVNTPLLKNLTILNELMEGHEIKSFPKQFLLGKGYSFDVLTHFDRVNNISKPCIFFYSIEMGDGDSIVIKRTKWNKND